MAGPIVSMDCDVFRYRVGFASQKRKYKVETPDGELLKGLFDNKTAAKEKFGKDMVAKGYKFHGKVKPDPKSHAFYSCKQQIESVIKATGARKIKMYLSGSQRDNFRINRGTFLPYKGGRLLEADRQPYIERGEFLHAWQHYDKINAQPKPYHYDNLTEYLKTQWDSIEIHGMEADDELTIQQTKAWDWAKTKRNPERILRQRGHVVATIDKDLQQAPGWYFDFRPDTQRAADRPDWKFVNGVDANENLWKQVITGDMTDWIYGVEGYGSVKALEILRKHEPKDWEQVVKDTYELWWLDMANKKEEDRTLFERVLFENHNPTDYYQEVYDLIYLFRNYDEANLKIAEVEKMQDEKNKKSTSTIKEGV